jgi:hypothetical protein
MNFQISQYTIFTWMQDNFNLRHSSRNETSAKKNILLLMHTCNTQSISDYLPLPISATFFSLTISTFLFLQLTSNIHSTMCRHRSHPFHWIYIFSKSPSQHFWWNVKPCCYDQQWLNNTFMFLGLYTWTHEEDLQFSPHIVLVMLRIFTYMCFGLLVSLWSCVNPGFFFFSFFFSLSFFFWGGVLSRF